MYSEYMRTDDSVLIVNSYGNLFERENTKNIEKILISENRLEELDKIIRINEKEIKNMNRKMKNDKRNFSFSMMFCISSLVLVLGLSSYCALAINLPFIIPSCAVLAGISILFETSIMVKQIKRYKNFNKLNKSEIIGYESKINVAEKKKILVELELKELEKNKEKDNKSDSYYVMLNDEKYISNLYRKLDNSYKISKDNYLNEKKKSKVLKRVKNN